jgi:DNA-binding NtrC family response regulator
MSAAPVIPSPATNGSTIIGSSAAMKRLRLQVRRIGPHFRTVLLIGEPGTGKELVARALHGMAQSEPGPFVVCNKATIENALVECETGPGTAGDVVDLMQGSVHGTLFLDGISELSLEGQSRLLRVLKQYESAQNRVDASQRIDLRVIASTSEDLRILVSTGRFRQELYQRLATVDVTLPPLRDRMEDLPELASHFLERFARLYGREAGEIADEAIERMQEYRWPGNVGELESVMRNGVLQSESEVFESHHLPRFAETSKPDRSTPSTSKNLRLQDVVEQHVLRVLKDCGGNKLRAAEALGISRSTLYRMLETGASMTALR